MYRPASFVLTRDRVFWSRKTDSHESIIEEFGLNQDGVRGPNIVRVEVVPPDGDMRRPLAEWLFVFDQDMVPDWCDKADCERWARESLTEWAKAKLVIDATIEVRDAQVYAHGSSTVTAYGRSTVTACEDQSTVICLCVQPVRPSSPLAVVIDKTGDKVVCYTLD